MSKSPAATLSLLEKTLPVVFPHHPAALFLAAVVNPDAYLAQPPGPDTVVLADPVPAPTAEVDIAAIIADDPNQIGAPPAKPKRGWWRR